MIRRLITLVLVALFCCSALSLAEEMTLFVDDAGRSVEVPAKIERIAPSGVMAQMMLFSLAPSSLVSLSSRWDAAVEAFLDISHLPVLGALYGTGGELNLESLAAADPQVIIDVGEPKDTIVEDMDAVSRQVGIPAVHIGSSLRTMPEAYRRLGALLGIEEEAEALAAYCEEVFTRAEAIMEKVGEENKKTILYLIGDVGQNVTAKGSYHGELLDLFADNVAVVDNPTARGTGNESDMEQITMWDPEIIIFAPESVYAHVGSDPVWQTLTAVQQKQYVEAPYGPFNWLGFPPSIQLHLGALWLPTLLYPEACDYDLYTEVQRFYALFYHYDLSLETFNELMANAMLPAR
jgi:iron complex transport system substrate-binding protein